MTAPAMSTDGMHPAPERAQASSAALWFGVFGAPAAWSVQTLVNVPLAAHACYPRLAPLTTPAFGAVRGLAKMVSLLAIAVGVAALAVAWRLWRRTRGEHQARSGRGTEHGEPAAALETGEGRTRFMALAGVLTSVTFLILSVAHATSVLVVRPCF
jgi:hypothetical protein